MSEYKRWISYVYCYENNVKKNNVGYIKFEVRGPVTKVYVNVKVLSVNEPMPVYLYARKDGIMKAYLIGTLNMDKNAGRDNFEIDTMLGSGGLQISDTCGVIIYHSNEKFFGSEWDDIEISIEDMVIDDVQTAEDLIATSLLVEYEEKEAGIVEAEPEQVADTLPETVPETTAPETAPETALETAPETEPETAPDKEPDISEIDLKNEHKVISMEEVRKKQIEEAAGKMLATYPRMFPFENDEMVRCVRIEPQDIGQLPIDTWALANNSFLLHGYYSYRHLILMCTMDEIKPAYLIGVPGIFHNRDEYMAQMFGFGLFKPMKACKSLQGEFGYWCVSITNMPDSK